MKRILAALWVVLGGFGAAPAVMAQDLALFLANERYDNFPLTQNALPLLALQPQFRDVGFEVVVLRDVGRDRIADADRQIIQRIINADRVVVVISGYLVNSDRDSWLLASDADVPNVFTVGQNALSVGGILDLLKFRPGESLLAVAETPHDVKLAHWLESGFVPRDIPQGVTVVSGPPQQVRDFIAQTVLVPGRSLAAGLEAGQGGLSGFGYLPRSAAFLPEGARGADPAAAEQTLWERAQSLNTFQSYQDYLRRYPRGRYSQDARQRADALRLTPQDRARLAEEALGLSRDQRREIQRDLTLIGYDTAGIDGILGNRSRGAISRWQSDVGVAATGYLNTGQIARIRSAAVARGEELRIEAERRRLAEEREDRQFWNSTGAGASEEGLRDYLHRYPDGLYSDAAREALSDIERQQRRQARAAEREAWDQAVMQGTLDSYEAYLAAYPQGRFADEARARAENLRRPETPQDIVDAAEQEEARLSLNGFTRQLIEAQLRRLNLDPGPADGRFTRETRRALRRYQRANSLPVTGYVTRDTVVRLLASAVDN